MAKFRIICTQEIRYVVYVDADTREQARAKVEADVEAEGEPADALEIDNSGFVIGTIETVED